MEMTRRELLKGSLASLGSLAAPGGLFATPPGWRPPGRPNLVFGVVSDTHMRCHYGGVSFYNHNGWFYDDQALVIVLKYFKSQGADAVLHCGDVTDCGMVREMEYYKEAWDKVFGSGRRPANMIVTGNHDVYGDDYWATCVAKSKDPAVYKKLRLGSHNLKAEMERIFGEPYDDVWHREVKGYHFFGFGWPNWTGEPLGEKVPYHGRLYHDTPFEGNSCIKYIRNGLWMTELMRREREAGRLDPKKPFFTATHALYRWIGLINYAQAMAIGVPKGRFCRGLGFHGHGHGSDARFSFGFFENDNYPRIMCSTLAYWKSHGGEGETPLFAKGFGDGRIAQTDADICHSDHALLVRVYDDCLTVTPYWVDVMPRPKWRPASGELGLNWVMPFGDITPDSHPFQKENYKKVIGSPEFPKGAKLVVEKGTKRTEGTKGTTGTETAKPSNHQTIKLSIPLADGNPDCRVYGYQVVVAGEPGGPSTVSATDATKRVPPRIFKSVYARGYCMAPGFEPDGGVTALEIPVEELPAGKELTIAVRPCSSLGTKGRAIAARYRA